MVHDEANPLQTTQHSPTVTEIADLIQTYRGRLVEDTDLREPADTVVQEIIPDGRKHTEADYFA